jgi:aspartyl protease family protein
MERALAGILLIGLVIGLAWPSEPPAPEPPKPTAAAPSAPPATDPVIIAGVPPETRIEREENGHFYVHAQVNGQPIKFLVDTGATVVALTEADPLRIGLSFSPDDYQVIGRGVSGEVRGQFVELDSVVVDEKEVSGVRAAVIEGGSVSLLGQSYLSRIASVQMSGNVMTLH